jgi:hypothetical protein
MVQVVEHLLSMCKALDSIPSPTKNPHFLKLNFAKSGTSRQIALVVTYIWKLKLI